MDLVAFRQASMGKLRFSRMGVGGDFTDSAWLASAMPRFADCH
jgi:hypothetical protein